MVQTQNDFVTILFALKNKKSGRQNDSRLGTTDTNIKNCLYTKNQEQYKQNKDNVVI